MKNKKGLSLIELIMAMAIAMILVLVIGVLLVGSSRSFHQVNSSIHNSIQEDSRALMAAFGAIGRKSNRTNYIVYKIIGETFIEAEPDRGESVAKGQAVEFRYWDEPFYELSQNMDEMNITDTGTNYALFYLHDDELYVDYGTVIDGVGGISNGYRKTSNITTQCLAHQVDTTQNTDIFSHEITGGVGSGCVSLNLTLIDDTEKTLEVKTATLIRVVWPQ